MENVGKYTSPMDAMGIVLISITLPETNSILATENGWLEYDRFLLGAKGLFSGANC